MLEEIDAAAESDLEKLVSAMISHLVDGRLKMYVTSRALRLRRRQRDLFSYGDYHPLRVQGKRSDHAVAFGRTFRDQVSIAAVSRFSLKLGLQERPPVGADIWGDTEIELAGRTHRAKFRDVFTGRILVTGMHAGTPTLPLAEVFARLPIALLTVED
jgi:(1->4)-alpha-D-glucan 1-alpha-D-glucosylmutase